MQDTLKIANHLTAHRQKRGLSAADLAQRAGIGRQTVYAIESGTYMPNTAVALRLARTLEVGVEDLFSLPSDAPAAPLPTEQVTLLPHPDTPRAGDPMQLCRVDRRTIASSPSPSPLKPRSERSSSFTANTVRPTASSWPAAIRASRCSPAMCSAPEWNWSSRNATVPRP